MLGHEFDLRGPIDWHRDPRSEFRWPRAFYADLPLYELPSGVDVKYVWELGRQQYAAELSRAWVLTEDRQAADLAHSIVMGWIESNPVYEGIHWTSGLEVAMRAISWIWTLAAMADWDGWQRGELDRVATSLAEHATYLEHHLSFYSSPYNHLIGEATALLLITNVLGDSADTARWRARAQQVLNSFGPKQFYSDGFCVEQATGYHFYTLGFLSLAIAAGRQMGRSFSRLETAVRRAFVAGAGFRRPDGRWPVIGDVDSARSIPVHHSDYWSFDSLCQLGAALFDEPCLKQDSVDAGEETYWLLGNGGLERWRLLDIGSGPGRSVLRDSGYVVASDARDWFLFDAGPIADGLHAGTTPSVAHGHADMFQVLYVKDGVEVLADAGMPFYGGGQRDWTAHFRSAAAHNTLEIEGAGPVKTAGSLAWSHEQPRPEITAHLTDESWLCSGRATWGDGAVTIERHVLVKPGRGLWTADVIETDRPRSVRWHWHSRQPFALGDMEEAVATEEASGGLPFDAWATGGTIGIEPLVPHETSPQAWISSGYGEWEEAVVVRVTAKVERRMLVVTRIGSRTPFEVRCGGWILAAQAFDEVDLAETSVSSNDGVCWRIAEDSGTESIAPGAGACRDDFEEVGTCPEVIP